MRPPPAFLSRERPAEGSAAKTSGLLGDIAIAAPMAADAPAPQPERPAATRGGMLLRAAMIATAILCLALGLFLYFGDRLVGWAAREERGALLRALIRLRPSWANATDADGWPAIVLCATHGDLESVRALLDAGADPDAVRNDCMPAVGAAAARGHDDVAILLLERGAAPWSARYIAAVGPRKPSARLLAAIHEAEARRAGGPATNAP